jgi:hypothetical protein
MAQEDVRIEPELRKARNIGARKIPTKNKNNCHQRMR